jgi:hypothetical protein
MVRAASAAATSGEVLGAEWGIDEDQPTHLHLSHGKRVYCLHGQQELLLMPRLTRKTMQFLHGVSPCKGLLHPAA